MIHVRDLDAEAAWRSCARLLIIDDEPGNLEFLRHVLETEGYGPIETLSDPQEALDRLEELDPDLIVLDLMMPQLDGFEVMRRVRERAPADSYLPILITTADPSPETRRRALSVGAKDFLTKPLSPAEVRLRVRNLLETRFLHEQLREYSLVLEHKVTERTRELEEARLEILYRLARAAEYRDDETGQHTLRVGRLAARLAQVMGLSADAYELMQRAAPLHDIGKIGIPDAILLKPDRLQPHEIEVMQTHTTIGASILGGSRSALLRLAEEIALNHHERWDGKGYPNGLGEDEIPISGRLVSVADVFDSLTHERPYKRAWTVREAVTEIQRQAGRQFDPHVVEALLRVAPESRVLEAEAAGNGGIPVQRGAIEPPSGGYTAIDAEALAARLRAVEAERDDLARQIHNLRRQLNRRNRKIDRLTRETQPN